MIFLASIPNVNSTFENKCTATWPSALISILLFIGYTLVKHMNDHHMMFNICTVNNYSYLTSG